MGFVDFENIVALKVEDDKVVCKRCLGRAEEQELKREDIITGMDLDDRYLFCDRCGTKLSGLSAA